jgi:hypothetical protein
MALLNRKDLQQRHAEFDLPPLSLSTIQRLEKRGLLNPIKLNGDNSPAYYEEAEVRSLRDRCRVPRTAT